MIDPKAVIDPKAEIDEGVTIGAFSIISADVRIGKGTVVGPHVVIKGTTRIGEDNHIFQYASIGEDPQDKKYAGEQTRLEIGDRNVIREFVTMNRGSVQDAVATRIGNDNLFMAYTHVAHDCQIGNHVIMANAASLAGHVKIDDWAILSGFTMVHQFSHIGAHSFCGMGSAINKNVPPYVTVSGQPAKPYGINSEGLRRRGFDDEVITQIKRAYKLIYKKNIRLTEAVAILMEMRQECDELAPLLHFIKHSERSIVR